jgi:hypothetical protein
MTQDEINVNLFNEVIKRRHEADELRMAHEIDQLRGALLAMRDHYRQWSIPGTLNNRRRAVFGDAMLPAGTAQALIDEDRGA